MTAEAIITEIEKLSPAEQAKVVAFIQSLEGIPQEARPRPAAERDSRKHVNPS